MAQVYKNFNNYLIKIFFIKQDELLNFQISNKNNKQKFKAELTMGC